MRQGEMLGSFVVTAYFKILGRRFYNEGVRVVDDTFMKWLSLEDETYATLTRRYRLSELETARVLLIPIFNGGIQCGHYSLVVIDKITSWPGLVSYFGSLAVLDDSYSSSVFDAMVRKGFITDKMIHQKHIGGGLTGMVQQGASTNDCGAFACCMAAAYINCIIRSGALTKKNDDTTKPSTTAHQVTTDIQLHHKMMDSSTSWGKFARHHIGDTVKKNAINMDDPALSSISIYHDTSS
jgi:hypothetical protein